MFLSGAILIVLVIFTAPINCIVGGKNVTEEDQQYFNYCVYITNKTETPPKIHFSGFIFDKNTIITAAHNVVDEPATTLLVRAGSRLYQSGGVLVSVSKVILHPQYNIDAFDNDIAILKLQNELIFDNTTGPIKIAGPQEEIYSKLGTNINSTGFGRCEWGNNVCNLRWG